MDPNVSSVVVLVGLAVGVDYSLFYLRREREERRAGRTAIGLAAGRGGDLGPGGARLRPDRDRGDGRDAAQRRPDLHLVRGRDDDGRRGGDVRLADGAAGGALEARRPGRKGPDPVPRRACASGVDGRSIWAGDDRPRHAPPGRRHGRLGGRAGRPGGPGARHAHQVVSGADDLPRDIPVVQTYDRVTAAFPGEARGRDGRGRGRRRQLAAGRRGDRRPARGGRSRPGRRRCGQRSKRSADGTVAAIDSPDGRQRQRRRRDAGDGAGPRASSSRRPSPESPARASTSPATPPSRRTSTICWPSACRSSSPSSSGWRSC